MRFLGIFTVFFFTAWYSQATVLYESPFKKFAPTLSSSLILTEINGEESVCGIMKGNLVCISEGGRAEKITEIEGKPKSSVFLDGCFLGVFNREGNWIKFKACIDGRYEESHIYASWNEYGDVYLFKGADQRVYALGYSKDGSKICLDLESGEVKELEDIPTPFYLEWPRGMYSYFTEYTSSYLIFEYDIIDGFTVGAVMERYSSFPVLCPIKVSDLSECKRLNLGNISRYYCPALPFFIFAEGNNLYVAKVVDKEDKYLGMGGVFPISDAESGIPDERFTALPGFITSGYDNFVVFGFQGTPYFFKEQEVAYTIKNGKMEPVFSFSAPESPFTYFDGKLFWVVGSPVALTATLVSVDTNTKAIKAFPLPWNATLGNIYSTSERIVVTADNIGIAVFSPDGEMLGKVIPENGRFDLCRVLNSGYIAVVIKKPDNSYDLELYDSDLNLIRRLNLKERVFPDFVAGNYLGARHGGDLYIYDLTTGEIASIFSSWGISINSSLYIDGMVFLSGSSTSEKGHYSFFTYFDLDRFIKENLENPWFLVDTFPQLVIPEVFAEGNAVYVVNTPFLSEDPVELVSFQPKGNSFVLDGLKNDAGIPPYTPFLVKNVNGKLSFVWMKDGKVFYQPLRNLVEPIPLSTEKDVKVGWRDYFISRPYPLGFPFTLSGSFYIDPQENSIIPESESVTVYITTPNYDTPYDFYIAILGEDNTITFVSTRGFIREPEPLFKNIEGGMFYRFEGVPIEVLPKGTYYIMIRKAGSAPFDFEYPGYRVIETFRLK